MILLSIVGIVFFYMTAVFILATYRKDNSIVDVAWGIGFILIALFTLCKTALFLPRQILATLLVVIWGLRLSLHIYLRNKGKGEDPRYKAWRMAWGKYVVIRSFFQVFMLQGLMMLLIASSIITINLSHTAGINILDIIGLSLWIIGFMFESIGDYQLARFLDRPRGKQQIMNRGLWRYTRHPNYFGEVTLWWGMFIIALSVPYWQYALISPITITILLLFVSGIPMTERMFDDNPAYQAYKKETSSFFPWFTNL